MIPCGGISQIDGLEAGSITYEDPSLLVVMKYVKTTLAHQIRWQSLKVMLPPSTHFDCFHHGCPMEHPSLQIKILIFLIIKSHQE